MIFLVITAVTVVVLSSIYLFVTMPSFRRHSVLSAMMGKRYGHRGLHSAENGAPENTMAAFERCVVHGFGFEFDVRLTADGKLMIMHDDSTLRMTGTDLRISRTSSDELDKLRVGQTEERIPYFSQVLEMVSGRVPLIIELKAENGNHAQLCEAVERELSSYKGEYVVESFDPRVVRWYKLNRPQTARGQLTEDFNSRNSDLTKTLGFVMHNYLTNFLTRPDFIAMRLADREGFTHKMLKNVFGARTVVWTAQTEQEMKQCESEGDTVIFENFIPDE